MKNIFLFFLIVLPSSSFSQVATIKEYTLDQIPYSTGANIKACADSGFVTIIGLSNQVEWGVLLTKYDSKSCRIWSNFLDSLIYLQSDVLEVTDGFLVTGQSGQDRIQLIKLDTNGNLIWRRLYCHPVTPSTSGGSHYGLSLHRTGNTTLFIYGIYETPFGSPHITIVKAGLDGSLIWTKQYHTTYSIGRAVSLKDGSILSSHGSKIVNIDTSGIIKWAVNSGSTITYSNRAVGLQNGIIFSTLNPGDTNFVYKLDLNGNLLWESKKMLLKPCNAIDYNNKIIVCGTTRYNGNEMISLAVLNAAGHLIAHNVFNSDNDLLSARIAKTKQGELVILAMYRNKYRTFFFGHPFFPTCSYEDIIAFSGYPGQSIMSDNASVSSINFSFFDAPITIRNYSPKEQLICSESFPLINIVRENIIQEYANIYPNPVRNNIVVEIQSLTGTEGIFRLYDISGKEIIHVCYNQNKFDISVKGLKPGIYYYKMSDSREVLSKGKLMISK